MSNNENNITEPHDLIVVGSSAGGVEALSILVSSLPKNFPAPIVLAQHLDPNRPSTLDVILQRRSALPIERVNTSSVLENGKIYVIPSNRHVSINDHRVEVMEDRGKRPRPSVDLLLTTAAQAYGDHLFAVILTGSGSDGAAGAVEVKNAGGTVIVQDPQTARYPSMPLALPPTVIDFEERVEQIGSLLYDLLTGVPMPPSEERTEDVLHSILEQVSNQSNIDFRPYKTSTILRRIVRRMAVTHVRTIGEYADYLKMYPEEVGELVKAFLINVTQFFRDKEAYNYLQEEILPALIINARSRDRVLRFWAAGCATGEEPYSLAMLLADMLGAELTGWSVKIFATDLDEAAINFARRGIYSENLLKGVSQEYRERFFERVDQGYRISKTLRQMVIFGQQDLSRSAPFPRIDMVMCRNVLIYFTSDLQDYVLNQFAFSLNAGGYLFLGKAETVRPAQQHYELINKHWKVYRCIGGMIPSIRKQPIYSQDRLVREGRTMKHSHGAMGRQRADPEQNLPSLELGQLRRFNELLLRFLPIGVVVIDRSYHIVTANGTARRLLGLHDIGSDQDFLHAVHGIPYPSARNAIDTVFREHSVVSLAEMELDVETGGSGRFVNLSIALMQLENTTQEYAAISISDVTEQIQTQRQVETAQAEQTQLMNELGNANKRLSDMNKELMDANEELQVANEELMLTHEELQASIEEFETTNEELQATNEELETNNEELQATNEELETTNDELRARTNELQETATILDSERVRLAEMVELAPFYILVLHGNNLIVDAYNPRYSQRLSGRTVQGLPLEDVLELFGEPSVGTMIMRLARGVMQFEEVCTTSRMLSHDARDPRQERYFVYTLVPSHDINGKVDGVIVYGLDETEQGIRDAEEERERLKIIFDNTPLALLALYDATTAQLVIASPRYLAMLERVHGLTPTVARRHQWHEVTLVTPHEQASLLWNTVRESQSFIRLPEIHYLSSHGSHETIWDYSLTPIQDVQNQGVVRYVLVSAIDNTEQVQAGVELEQLDAFKDEFLSMATHELRSPLTVIQADIQAMQRQAAQDGQTATRNLVEQWSETLERIGQQTQRMNRLINEMMDATQLRERVFQLRLKDGVNIIELVQRVIEQQTDIRRAGHEIHLLVNLNSDQATGTLDAHRVEQVLQNLLSNASKYSPGGKAITVSIDKDPAVPEAVVIAVQDEGEGIPSEEQTRIFDLFYRASTQQADGLGLGLYITHELVLAQGGRIWLESTPGKGSAFFFSLSLHHKG